MPFLPMIDVGELSEYFPCFLGFLLAVFGVGLSVWCVRKELKDAEDESSD